MTEQEMWEAVIQNDSSYDGVFFYAVKTTGIYCRPLAGQSHPNGEISAFSKPHRRPATQDFVPVNDAGAICLTTTL